MDSRAEIKVEFSAYGQKFVRKMSINYWPEDDGIDKRVKELFIELWHEATLAYEEKNRAADAEEAQNTSTNTGMAAEAAQIADEMDTVIIRLNKPHGEIDWTYVISEWRRRLRHA